MIINMTKQIKNSSRLKEPKPNALKHWPIYLIMLPALLMLLIFNYVPMIGILIAFKDVSPYGGIEGMIEAPFIGFDQFERFFSSHYFWSLLGNTLSISIKKLIVGFPAPIILALLLNELLFSRFKKVVQTVSYLPHFISTVILSGLIITMLSTNGGLINQLLGLFGVEPIFFLGSNDYFQNILVVSNLWKTVGWNSIIYLAAIAGIDMQQHEAAIIDGANRFQRAIYITLPGMASIIIIMLILAIGNLLNAGFEEILLLYSPAVYESGDIIDTYVYREGIVNLEYSYTTAVNLFKSVVCLVLVGTTNWIANKLGQSGIW